IDEWHSTDCDNATPICCCMKSTKPVQEDMHQSIVNLNDAEKAAQGSFEQLLVWGSTRLWQNLSQESKLLETIQKSVDHDPKESLTNQDELIGLATNVFQLDINTDDNILPAVLETLQNIDATVSSNTQAVSDPQLQTGVRGTKPINSQVNELHSNLLSSDDETDSVISMCEPLSTSSSDIEIDNPLFYNGGSFEKSSPSVIENKVGQSNSISLKCPQKLLDSLEYHVHVKSSKDANLQSPVQCSDDVNMEAPEQYSKDFLKSPIEQHSQDVNMFYPIQSSNDVITHSNEYDTLDDMDEMLPRHDQNMDDASVQSDCTSYVIPHIFGLKKHVAPPLLCLHPSPYIGKDDDIGKLKEILDDILIKLGYLNEDTSAYRKVLCGPDNKIGNNLLKLIKSNPKYEVFIAEFPCLHLRKSMINTIFKSYSQAGIVEMLRYLKDDDKADWNKLLSAASIESAQRYVKRLSPSLHMSVMIGFMYSLPPFEASALLNDLRTEKPSHNAKEWQERYDRYIETKKRSRCHILPSSEHDETYG
ncbi:unnamed protein product, partial [Owenia fusiformis]